MVSNVADQWYRSVDPKINLSFSRVYSISQKYAHGFVVLCFVVVMQSFIMYSHEVFIQIHQGCFAGTGAIVRLPQCQWSKPDGYGKISQCITTTKHSKAKTVCIFLGIYCMCNISTYYQPEKIASICVPWPGGILKHYNSLVPERWACTLIFLILKFISRINISIITCEGTLC